MIFFFSCASLSFSPLCYEQKGKLAIANRKEGKKRDLKTRRTCFFFSFIIIIFFFTVVTSSIVVEHVEFWHSSKNLVLLRAALHPLKQHCEPFGTGFFLFVLACPLHSIP